MIRIGKLDISWMRSFLEYNGCKITKSFRSYIETMLRKHENEEEGILIPFFSSYIDAETAQKLHDENQKIVNGEHTIESDDVRFRSYWKIPEYCIHRRINQDAPLLSIATKKNRVFGRETIIDIFWVNANSYNEFLAQEKRAMEERMLWK